MSFIWWKLLGNKVDFRKERQTWRRSQVETKSKTRVDEQIYAEMTFTSWTSASTRSWETSVKANTVFLWKRSPSRPTMWILRRARPTKTTELLFNKLHGWSDGRKKEYDLWITVSCLEKMKTNMKIISMTGRFQLHNVNMSSYEDEIKTSSWCRMIRNGGSDASSVLSAEEFKSMRFKYEEFCYKEEIEAIK